MRVRSYSRVTYRVGRLKLSNLRLAVVIMVLTHSRTTGNYTRGVEIQQVQVNSVLVMRIIDLCRPCVRE